MSNSTCVSSNLQAPVLAALLFAGDDGPDESTEAEYRSAYLRAAMDAIHCPNFDQAVVDAERQREEMKLSSQSLPIDLARARAAHQAWTAAAEISVTSDDDEDAERRLRLWCDELKAWAAKSASEIEVPPAPPKRDASGRIRVIVEPANGRSPRRVVRFSCGDVEHTDKIDILSAFERDRALDRLAQRLHRPRHLLGYLHDVIVSEAEQPGEETKAQPAFTRLLTGSELLALDLKPRFLVRGVLVDGQPMVIGGRSKCLKTSKAIALAVALGSGTPFLNWFDAVRVPAGFWSGESGAATIRETAKRIASASGVSLADCDIRWCFDLPRLSQPEHLEHLEDTIRKQGIRVAILDPLYLCLLSAETAGEARNIFAMGPVLSELTSLGQRTGVTIILLHHFRKSGLVDDENPCPLEELAQSGVAEWARQWLLLQRRLPYQADGVHSLWMRCGGSAGHASLWGVNIDEGLIDPETFAGRKWEVKLAPSIEVREEVRRDKENRKAAEQEQRDNEHRERLLTVLRATPDGDTERGLTKAAHLNPSNFSAAIQSLLKEGRAERCKVTKNRTTFDGYRPTGR